MKSLLGILFFACTAVAQTSSYPAVGDKVTYIDENTRDILSYTIQSFDASIKKWKVLFESGKSSENLLFNEKDLYNKSQMTEIVNDCKKINGTTDYVFNSLGSFKTCKTKVDNENIWYGDVPFGIVRMGDYPNDYVSLIHIGPEKVIAFCSAQNVYYKAFTNTNKSKTSFHVGASIKTPTLSIVENGGNYKFYAGQDSDYKFRLEWVYGGTISMTVKSHADELKYFAKCWLY